MIPSCGVVAYMLERLEKGMWLWRTGKYDLMVLSGGVADYPYPAFDRQSYNDRMYDWIMAQPGHPDDCQIIRENKSRDSYENCVLTLSHLWERGIKNVDQITIVTQWQHGRRFKSTMRAYDVGDVVIEHTSYKLPLVNWLMEWLFIAVHIADPKGVWFLGPLNRMRRSR